MARAHFVKKARKDIYERGKVITYKSKRGKAEGQNKQRLDVTQPANKDDKVLIKAGESYYWWQFKGSNKSYSRERPKASQLTRSAFLSQLYDIMDRLSEPARYIDEPSDAEGYRDDIVSELESLRDECQDALDRMPDALQESSSSGELLRERIDALESAIDELGNITLDDYEEFGDDDLRDEAIESLGLTEEQSQLEEHRQDIEDEMDKIREEKQQDWINEKCDELSGVDISC